MSENNTQSQPHQPRPRKTDDNRGKKLLLDLSAKTFEVLADFAEEASLELRERSLSPEQPFTAKEVAEKVLFDFCSSLLARKPPYT